MVNGAMVVDEPPTAIAQDERRSCEPRTIGSAQFKQEACRIAQMCPGFWKVSKGTLRGEVEREGETSLSIMNTWMK